MFPKLGKQKNRDAVLGLDIGTTCLKAAVLRRTGPGLQLCEYAVRPLRAPLEKSTPESQLAEQLQQFMAGIKRTDRRACVAISCKSAIVCHMEFPRMPLQELKSALKLNGSRYLRRDFSNYYLDAAELVDPNSNGKDKKSPKMQVLVGGAQREEVALYRNALLAARIRPESIELAALSVVNAFQVSHPELCQKNAVLLLDIGARSTTINFLMHGLPLMTRIMHFGGTEVSEYIAQMLTLEFAAAEEQKIKMTQPVQTLLRKAISPLAREVRSSIDYFERQHDCHLSAAFACGGSALSPKLLEALSEEVGMRFQQWNPIQNIDTSQLNGAGPALTALAPSLAAAVGAAAARL